MRMDHPSASVTGIRLSRPVLLALLIVAALPVAVCTVPGLSDLPNHLARYHVFASHGAGGPIDRWYKVEWRWIGNLGIDLPVLLLTPWLGVEAATRLACSMIAPLVVLGLLALGRAAHGRITAGALLALPMAMAQPWMYGFVNYWLAIALALLTSAAWLAWRPHRWWLHALVSGAAALVVWTAHIQGWAVLLILVGACELARVRSVADLLRRAAKALPLLAPLAPMVAWRGGGPGLLWSYDRHVAFAKVMDFVTVLKGASKPLDLAVTALLAAAALLALAWAGRRRVDPGLALAATLLTVATVVLPTTMLGSWGADLRLAPVAVAVALLALGPAGDPRRERALAGIGAALFVGRAAFITVEWSRADAVLGRRLALLDRVPRGSRMGFVALKHDCGTPWVLDPERKLGGYAVVRRDAFTNTLFQIAGADLMTIRRPADQRWRDQSQDVASGCAGEDTGLPDLPHALAAMSAARFDTIWIAGDGHMAPPPGYRVAATTATDTLFARQDR